MKHYETQQDGNVKDQQFVGSSFISEHLVKSTALIVTPDEITWYDMPRTPDKRTEVWATRYRINQKSSSTRINR